MDRRTCLAAPGAASAAVVLSAAPAHAGPLSRGAAAVRCRCTPVGPDSAWEIDGVDVDTYAER